ncbi:MAG: MFS transporter [Verrucomicrobia bacterium]|nr:MFS transporter [Verrucomicrobiota bacterium]
MSAPQPGPSQAHAAYKWWVVVMLWFVCFFNYADRQAIFAVFPKLKEEFGFDKEQLGWIGSAFMWVYAGGALFAGLIVDRFRRKDLILGGCLFWSFVTVTTGWCSKLWHFVTVRALEGFGETFYFPASMSLTSDYHGPRTRSRALAFHQSSVYVGTILGSWIGAWFAEHHGWRLGFYFFGGAGMLLALVLYGFLREPRRGEADAASGTLAAHGREGPDCSDREHSPSSSMEERAGERRNVGSAPGSPPASILSPLLRRGERKETAAVSAGKLGDDRGAEAETLSLADTARAIFRSPTVPLLMLAFVGANFVATIFLTWTPTFLVEKFGFRLTTAGLSGSIYIHLASALSVPVAGWLADRLTRRFSGGRMMVQAAGLLVGAYFVSVVGHTDNTATLLVAMTLFGICKGFYDSGIFASLYDSIEPRARGTAAGLMNTVGWGGGALGPLFVGMASKYGKKSTEVENMSDAIAFGGVIYLVAALLIITAILLFRRRGAVSRP